MNKNIWIGILVVVVLVVGWMIYSSYKGNEVVVPLDQNTNVNNPVVQNNDGKNTTTPPNKQTFKSLITQKGSYKCTYDAVTTSGTKTDIIYISDGKLRGEFRDSGDVGNMMIYDGVTLYTWQEGKTVGTKVPLTSLAQLPSIIPSDLTSGASYGTSFNSVGWDCHQWIKVSSMLTPSTAVKFTAGN